MQVNIYKLSGLLAPIVAFLSIALAILTHPWFSLTDNAISDLGALDVEDNYILNIGLIVSGLLGIVFACGLYESLTSNLGKAGSIILLFGCLSLFLVGVFPEGTELHFPVSISFFILTALGILVVGLSFYESNQRYSVFTEFLIVSGFILTVNALSNFEGVAVAELIAGIIFSIWVYLTIHEVM